MGNGRNEYKGDTAAVCQCGNVTDTMENGFCMECIDKIERGVYKPRKGAPEDFKEAPLGLIPQNYFEDNRIADILGAVARCIEAGYKVPLAWIEEYNEIIDRRQKSPAIKSIMKKFGVTREKAEEMIDEGFRKGKDV